jgi:hypothetical protein
MGNCTGHMGVAGALRTPGDDLLRRTGLDEVVAHVAGINQAVEESHKALRANERAGALQLQPNAAADDAATRDMGRAQSHAREARTALKRKLDSDTWKTLKREYEPRKGDIEASLANARSYWIDAIHKGDVAPAEAAEMAQIWDQGADALRKGGVDGAFAFLDERFGELEKHLSAEQDFGRQAHSPLEWWQWLIIAAIVGVAVAVLVACLIWAGCSWIYSIFVALCWGTGLAGGWSGVCLGFTF